ncbi:hypothetical protein DAI22_01g228150 [Oryza sativa Japonica Group]|nr:hypothetical protein DAI22_01g228150 [Oryza sativa Japonica Group]
MGESDTLRRRRRAAPLVRMDGRVTGSRLQAPHQVKTRGRSPSRKICHDSASRPPNDLARFLRLLRFLISHLRMRSTTVQQAAMMTVMIMMMMIARCFGWDRNKQWSLTRQTRPHQNLFLSIKSY